MSSSFALILDTIPPNISINAPNYSAPETNTLIVVHADEALSDQDIYFVDAAGARHDYIFALDGDAYDGTVQFNDVAIGIGILYAQVWDDVRNMSALASKAINILPAATFSTEINDSSRGIRVVDSARTMAVSDGVRVLNTVSVMRTIAVSDIARKVEVIDEDVSTG